MKRLLFICVFLFLIIFSLIYPNQIISASKSGLLTWFEQILPALLPFTIISTLLIKSNLLKSIKQGGNILAIGITMCCGFIFGFPIGAKLASDFYRTNLLSEKQAILLAVTANNFSPMYVCGFVLPTLFSNNMHTFATYLLIYLFPLFLASCILLFTYKTEYTTSNSKNLQIFQMNMSLFDESIIQGFLTLIKLCGYIVLFSILAQIMNILVPSPGFALKLILANLEITNGIQLLAIENFLETKTYIQAIQLLSFGGLSGILQTSSIFASSKLSIYKYIIGKVTLSLSLTLLSVIYVSYFIHLP